MLEISKAYMARELREKDRDVEGWARAYCARNKIGMDPVDRPTTEFVDGPTEPYLLFVFKSENQLDWFVRRGNARFPFFEFL
jgi:hypothetical protein